MDVIGIEYGDCKEVRIHGDLLKARLWYIPNVGIRNIEFTDTEDVHFFGKPFSTETYKEFGNDFMPVIANFADSNQRPIGLSGRWKNSGMTALGIISFDTGCIPEEGVYNPPDEDKEPIIIKEIVYVDKIVETIKIVPGAIPDPIVVEKEVLVEKEADPTMMIVAVIVSIVVIIALNMLLCFCCLNRQKRQI